jgi:heptosyltransferase-2
MMILIRGTNWIGDAVMTIPAIKRLRRLFPEADLVLLTPAGAEGVFRDAGLVDEIVTAGSFFEQVSEIRRFDIDVAILFPNSFKSALAAKLGGAKRSFGYAAQNRSILLSDPVEVPEWKSTRHEVHYYLNLVEEVERAFARESVESDDPSTHIDVPAKARVDATAILANANVDRTKRLVGLAPGSTNSRAKRWTPEGFAELNDRLQKDLEATVVLLGSPADQEVSTRVFDLTREKPIDLTGKTDIPTAAALLAELDLLISNDMGLAHLAPAVDTPTIVIFGPTNPVTTRPFSNLATVVSAEVECAPCMLRDCPIDHRCMARISAEQVFELAKQKLANG